jgi:hypothetical protein
VSAGTYTNGARQPFHSREKRDPEQPVERSQNRSLPFSPEGVELNAESGILNRHSRKTAEEESRETQQSEGRHEPTLLGYIVMKVKPLRAEGLLGKHSRFELEISYIQPPRGGI